MVDRNARDQLALTIEGFLAEEIWAFDFHDQIESIALETDDETVYEVTYLLWFHYDDINDHTAALSRAEWDYFQRLLLLLRSGSSLQAEHKTRWGVVEAISLALLIAFVVGAFIIGFGWQLLYLSVPLAPVTIALWWWRSRASDTEETDEDYPTDALRLGIGTTCGATQCARVQEATIPASDEVEEHQGIDHGGVDLCLESRGIPFIVADHRLLSRPAQDREDNARSAGLSAGHQAGFNR